jgi:hypothetical protein
MVQLARISDVEARSNVVYEMWHDLAGQPERHPGETPMSWALRHAVCMPQAMQHMVRMHVTNALCHPRVSVHSHIAGSSLSAQTAVRLGCQNAQHHFTQHKPCLGMYVDAATSQLPSTSAYDGQPRP